MIEIVTPINTGSNQGMKNTQHVEPWRRLTTTAVGHSGANPVSSEKESQFTGYNSQTPQTWTTENQNHLSYPDESGLQLQQMDRWFKWSAQNLVKTCIHPACIYDSGCCWFNVGVPQLQPVSLSIYYLFWILQDQKHPRGDFLIQIQIISLI